MGKHFLTQLKEVIANNGEEIIIDWRYITHAKRNMTKAKALLFTSGYVPNKDSDVFQIYRKAKSVVILDKSDECEECEELKQENERLKGIVDKCGSCYVQMSAHAIEIEKQYQELLRRTINILEIAISTKPINEEHRHLWNIKTLELVAEVKQILKDD